MWVGQDRQVALTAYKRYHIPSYMGHNGWISLSLAKSWTEKEITGLIDESYRHFALKRMVKTLDGQ